MKDTKCPPVANIKARDMQFIPTKRTFQCHLIPFLTRKPKFLSYASLETMSDLKYVYEKQKTNVDGTETYWKYKIKTC